MRAPTKYYACGKFIDSGNSGVSAGAAGLLRRRPAGEGRKKTAGFAGGFSGISVALYAPSTLSIRQRSEMPKKVKIKLGGHDGDSVRQKS
ncbi:hypothetical protein ACVK00_003990 [Burkholderia sp. PvR073]|uniref:hypothetical protein n=1 Tax=Burkholderia ambifaria TaxID=152480 RepID=UPI003398B6A9